VKLLYHPQVSMRSYKHPIRWLLSSDAQLTKMRAYAENLPQSWKWYWLLPEQWQRESDAATRIRRMPNVVDVTTPHMDNVLEERFNFPFRELAEVYDSIRPDIILCEIPEHVRSWRAVQDSVGHTCPIITMVEHVDFYEETKTAARIPFMLRQMDGALAADKVIFPLRGMQEEWKAAAYDVCGGRGWHFNDAVWPGLFSPKEVDAQRAHGLAMSYNEEDADNAWPVLFLISRLSDNTRTRYKEIVGASNDLLRNGVKHVLWVANPNDGRSWGWVKQEALAYEQHPFGEKRLKREEYLRLLWAADVVPIMYDLSRIYSVGACEAVAAHNKVVTASPKYESAMGFACTPERNYIAEGLKQALTGHREQLDQHRGYVLEAHGIEAHAEQVKDDIMGLVHEAIPHD
jgi:hypothetical protein